MRKIRFLAIALAVLLGATVLVAKSHATMPYEWRIEEHRIESRMDSLMAIFIGHEGQFCDVNLAHSIVTVVFPTGWNPDDSISPCIAAYIAAPLIPRNRFDSLIVKYADTKDSIVMGSLMVRAAYFEAYDRRVEDHDMFSELILGQCCIRSDRSQEQTQPDSTDL